MSDQSELRKYVPALVWYRPFEPYAYAFIRFGTGFVLLMHGAQRLFFGAKTAELGPLLAGLSPSLIGTVELIGGAALAIGLLTRPLALLFALEWLAVALSAHIPAGKSWFMFGATEHFPALIVALCVAFVVRGGGWFSLDRSIGKALPAVTYAYIRILLGLLFLPIGIDKLFMGGAGRIAAGNILRVGVEPPLVWAWFVGCVEFSAAILLILGLFTRLAAFALAIELTTIIWFIVSPRGWVWTVNGVEVALLVLLVAIGIVFGGSGRYSLDRKIGREF
ncbi:MAG TPA: DoxX family protein [Alphaproteobacteria bacterium]|jgi:putative oxidoreductase|nr:DoxX family protein [Alphaproteobacteria bacterium]